MADIVRELWLVIFLDRNFTDQPFWLCVKLYDVAILHDV